MKARAAKGNNETSYQYQVRRMLARLDAKEWAKIGRCRGRSVHRKMLDHQIKFISCQVKFLI
jgi:hypothetical protein